MKTLIKIPSPLRRFTQQTSQVEIEAETVFEAMTKLCEKHPDLQAQLFDENGQLRNFVNLFLDRVDIKQQSGMATPLSDGCELRIVPAIAGGTDPLPTLSPQEISRYSRHIMLPELGMEGQQKLKAAKVLIIGAGGGEGGLAHLCVYTLWQQVWEPLVWSITTSLMKPIYSDKYCSRSAMLVA